MNSRQRPEQTPRPTTKATPNAEGAQANEEVSPLMYGALSLQQQAILAMQQTRGNAAVRRFLKKSVQPAPASVVARDADEDEIKKIEGEKLDIGALLDRCAALDAAQRDRMISKAGGLAQSIHEERLLACLFAAKFKGTMKRADFYNSYHELLDRMPDDQSKKVLDYVGPEVLGKTPYTVTGADGEKTSVMVDKRSIQNVGMNGAPGSSIVVGDITYVVVDGGVQFKTSKDGGPAGRNNNPGNITVDDGAPEAWNSDIGAYRGRNTDGRFAVFPTYERGKQGAIAWASKRSKSTLLQYFKIYAPASEKGNNPQFYADTVAAAVKDATGKTVDSSTTIETIVGFGGAAMEAFVKGQEKAEGFTQSNVVLKAKDSPDLPQEVRDFVGGFDKATANTQTISHNVAKAAASEKSP